MKIKFTGPQVVKMAEGFAKEVGLKLSAFITEAGVGRATIWRYRTKTKKPDYGVILKLKDARARLKSGQK